MNVLITGAASGIGRAVAELLAARGDQVWAGDVDLDGLGELAERWPKQLTTAVLDVRAAEQWDRVLDDAERAHGPLDVVLNVAGVLAPDRVTAVSDDDVDRQIDVNIKGVIFGTRAAAQRMVPRGRGQIINVGSLASLTPVPGLSIYAASKFAVRGFSLSAAYELAGTGVAVTLVLPDAVETPMLDLQKDRDEAVLTFSGRVLQVDEVRDAIVDAMKRRPIELAIPATRGRLAKAAALWPAASRALLPLFETLGRRGQRRARRAK